jgi:signal transduction histidine kinase
VGEGFYIFYQAAMVLSLVASVTCLVLIWQRRGLNGSGAMIALAVASFVWTLGFFLESHSSTLARQLFFNNIGYAGSLSVTVAWFVFSVNYTTGQKIIKLPGAILLSIIPLIAYVLIWTNDFHHLMWYDEYLTTSGLFTITKKTYGTGFWVVMIHNYILAIAGSVILIRRLFVGTSLYTRQAISLVVAAMLPLVWNFVFVFNLFSLPRKDLTPVMFAVSGWVIVYGLMRLRLFVAMPFARKFIIRQIQDGILAFDTKNRLIEINPTASKILDLSPDFVGSIVDNLPRRLPVLEMMVSAGYTGSEVTLKVGGEEKIYEVQSVPMIEESGTRVGSIVTMHDITERKDMQAQLIAQDRLVAIGELTSGVAHEINNPLAVIKGFMELLLKRDLPADVKDDINLINSEVDRAARIVSNLLTFSRKTSEPKVPVDINDAIEKTIDLRAYEQSNNNIRTELNLNPDLPKVLGSELQLRQVFMNIVVNAEFFMKEAHGQGVLTITTEKAGNFVRIICADDGPGIPEEDIKRIFNPFFTTKEVGKGTGLGLSIVHGIVTEHGGTIWVESTPGRGASFIIILPAYRRPEPA